MTFTSMRILGVDMLFDFIFGAFMLILVGMHVDATCKGHLCISCTCNVGEKS